MTTEIDFTDRRVKLVDEGLDLAIRITQRLDPLDVARRIGNSRLLAVASPDYLRRRGEPKHPGELAEHECLVYLPTQQEGWMFLVDGVMTTFPMRSRMRANNGDALLDAAGRGLGITVQPTFMTAAAIEAGSVRVILSDYPMPELGIHVILPGNRYVPQLSLIHIYMCIRDRTACGARWR